MTKDQLITALEGARGSNEVVILIADHEACPIASVEINSKLKSIDLKPFRRLDIADAEDWPSKVQFEKRAAR